MVNKKYSADRENDTGIPLYSRRSLFQVFLLPYVGLLALYLLVIGCGSTWLYFAARQAQTELVTEHIIEVVSPFVKELSELHDANKGKTTALVLSQTVFQLYQLLPYLKQVSIRDRQHGYGVRLSFNKQLVDVELEPLQGDLIATPDHQQLASQLHQESSPFFHIAIALTSKQGNPVQMDIAFDRAGLVGQISKTMQAIIHSIIGFSVIGFLSILIALAITLYTGLKTYKMDVRLQKIYQQAAMGKLSASLVHDLRNPLASIRANIKNLLITPEETEQVVDEMDHDILRLEQKLSDFLSLTKPRTSGFKKVDIKLLVQDVVKKSKPLLQEKNITLSIQLDSDLPEITVIPEDITDALFNVLVNAKNHTRSQGHIWLKVNCIDGKLNIMVEDDGPGIQAALLTKIFKPFFTTREDGHGLGLAIVKNTVEAHNGNIFAENRSPNGARITIILPFVHD